MDDLRWVLLGLGALFLCGLAWWELRKPRHSGRKDGDAYAADTDSPPTGRRIEPRMGESTESELQAELPSMRAVETGGDPPVHMLGERRGSPTSTIGISIAASVAVDSLGVREPQPVEVPPFDEPTFTGDSLAHVAPLSDAMGAMEPQIIDADETVPEEAAPEPPAPRRAGPPEPNWPPEDQRRIVSLRLVPRPPARFAGRTLRMAFDSCGLEFGAFSIFHLVDATGEVCASAANLMRPGTFTPAAMDGQYYHGVHLFCVLPGPMPAGRAVDELIALARDLAQRLAGIVLDEVGQPLDEVRAAAVRDAAEQAEAG